uniref:DNA-(apurinic or apyrimidinic site) lyase n=1 Tax=Nothobranchius rachovii TaxID=451742 RepID=A0A1A8RLX4_9TELE
MVEGPGCTLNGEKIRSKVKTGQEVKQVRGSLTNKNNSETNAFHGFLGCRYTGVETLGKELFMYFGSRALRLHFGMNGSMNLNPAQRKVTTGSAAVLEIHLTNDTVAFFDSTVEIRLTEDCKQKVRAMESLDVCSSKFSFSRSEEAVRSQSSRMLCDVLLDQAVMPGVGNIIKNEALFDSGFHPAVKKMRIDHSPFPSNKAQNEAPNSGVWKMEKSSGATLISPSPSAPCCASHCRPAVLRVVHKEGENKGRQFYSCSLPRETKCNFFEWADLHFPSCHHGKRCLMRTVLKLGPNNGRNFYTCSFQKGKQCDFFQWAENGPGVSILPGC